MRIENNNPLKISLQAWFGLFGLGIALWLVIKNFWLVTGILLILFGAWLISLAIRPVVNFLSRWRIPPFISVLGAYLALIGLFILIGTLLAPAINTEINMITTQGPQLAQNFLSQIKSLPFSDQWLANADKLAPNLAQSLQSMISPLLTTLSGLGSIAIDLFVIFILVFFLTTDQSISISHLVQEWGPKPYRNRLDAIHKGIADRLTHWIWAQAAVALYFAVMFSLGLALLKVPFALSIGLVGGILEIVPYFGGFVAGILAMLSALTVSPLTVLWVFLLYVVVIEIESHIIAPLLYGRSVGLHPVIVLIALLFGLRTGGILGIFLAVPLAVVIDALVRELYSNLVPAPQEPVSPPSQIPLESKQ